MSFWVMNLGCKVNKVESDSIASALSLSSGEALSGQSADLIIVNTCTVTSDAEKKTRKAIRRALSMNVRAKVIVTGCAASIDPQFYASIDKRIFVEPDKSKVVALAKELLESEEETVQRREKFPLATFPTSSKKATLSLSVAAKESVESNFHTSSWDYSEFVQGDKKALLRWGENFPTRVGIKVQDGCDNACTYCIVRTARGRARSRPYNEILYELNSYEQIGIREVVLTGINLGSYFHEGYDLPKLLAVLLEANDTVRYRISSVEPCDIDTSLISLMAQSQGRICRHLHLPLQSGSSKVLKKMARPYNADYFRELVDLLYASIPTISLSTDIIVGFPGETEEDFEESFQLAKHCGFSKIHIFRYSPRKGTPAATMSNQLSPEIKVKRAQRLAALAQMMRKHDFEKRQGQKEKVLVEAGGRAMSESYHHIPLPDTHYVPGSLVEITL